VTTAPLARALGPRGSRSVITEDDGSDFATGSVNAVIASIPAWWAERAYRAGLDGVWADVEYALDLDLPSVADVSPSIDSTVTPHGLGRAYTTALTPGSRARFGRHYTPEYLAAQMWQATRRELGHSAKPRVLTGMVRDPSCGSGALLLAPLREHLAAARRVDPRLALAGLPSFIEGCDTDKTAVLLANVILGAEALPVLGEVPANRRRPLPQLASVRDGLLPVGRDVKAVVMNPPYGRVKLSVEERTRFDPYITGHANLYSLFLAASLEDIDAKGVITALVPTSFTAGRYFSKLREQASRRAPLREISFVSKRDAVFDGVLQETCIATFSTIQSRRTNVLSVDSDETGVVAKVSTPKTGRPWILPRQSVDAVVAASANGYRHTLRDLGWKVSTGPLVWNRRRDDLAATKSQGTVPVIWAADIDGGVLHQDSARDSMRYMMLSTERDFKTFALSDPAILIQRTTAPEQKRRLVLAALTIELLDSWGGAVVLENHVNALMPVTGRTPDISHSLLARLLATDTMDRVVRCISGSVAVSAYEIESIPMPGKDILAAWEELDDEQLTREVRAAYNGVTVS
jgi:adenine-specific DNA-methyltransferase